MVKILTALALVSFTALSACNTVAGAGADIRAGGEAIEDSAQTVKSNTY